MSAVGLAVIAAIWLALSTERAITDTRDAVRSWRRRRLNRVTLRVPGQPVGDEHGA